MKEIKKAQDISPAPNAHTYYNRAINACLILFLLSILILVLGQVFNNDKCTFLAIGIMCAAAIFDLIIIQEDK